MKRLGITLTVALLCLLGTSVAKGEGEKVYWTVWSGDTGVWRANIDGTQQEQILDLDVQSLSGIGVDLPNAKLYIGTGYDLLRSNFDGSGLQTIVSGVGDYAVHSVYVDSQGEKVYWSTRSGSEGIRRANLDGSSIETVFVPAGGEGGTYHMAIDQANQKLYFAGHMNIYRSDLDGANLEDLLTIPITAHLGGLDIDVANGKMYFTTWPGGTVSAPVYRADMDGGNVEQILGYKTADLVLDTEAGKMYWPQWFDAGPNYIMRANLDGTGIETPIPLMGLSNAMVFVVPEPATITMLSLGGLAILRRRKTRRA